MKIFKSIAMMALLLILFFTSLSAVACECDPPCTGCQECVDGTCVDDDSNCTGCRRCFYGNCFDDNSKCTGCKDCNNGLCVNNDNNCSGCESCNNGQCVDDDSKCPEVCINGICKECRSDADCGECGICQSYYCYEGIEADFQCATTSGICSVCVQGDCVDDPHSPLCAECGECQNGSCVPNESLCQKKCYGCRNVGPKIEPPFTIDPWYECVYECTEGTCCDEANDQCVEAGEWNPGFSLSIDIPDSITGAIESAVNAIPKVSGFELEDAEIIATGNVRDCCDDNGNLIEDGEYEISGSVSLSVELDEIEVWGDTIKKEWQFAGNTYSFSAGAEIDISIDSSVSITGGKRANECIPEECLFGSASVDIGVTGEVTAGAKICKNKTGDCDTCDGCCVGLGVNATITGAISGTVTYNETDCDDGFEGDISVGIEAEISVDVGCTTLILPIEIV